MGKLPRLENRGGIFARRGFLGDFEETVLVTEDGAELLTNAAVRSWSLDVRRTAAYRR